MSITNALNNALSGLRANGRLADITAGNLANALTPGYGRQEVALASSVTGTQGTGVRVAGVVRVTDPELSTARRMADGDLAERATGHSALQRLEAAFGTLEDPGSLGALLARFEASLRALGDTPENGPRQQAAAEAAGDLAAKFNALGQAVTDLRAQTDRGIASTVEATNTALEGVARLNRQIQIAVAAGRETAPLIDRREALIDQVAQALPVRQSIRPDGVIELRTLEGIGLADVTARRLDYTATPVYEPGLRYDDGAGTLSGLTLQGIDITPGGPGAQAVRGGALAGLFETRDTVAPEIETQLDSLAADLVTRLADPAIDTTLAPGDAGLFTDRGSAFALADITGIASRIALNAAVDPAEGGDPALLRDGLNAASPGPSSEDGLLRALADALSAPRDVTAPPATPGLAGQLSLAERIDGVVERIGTARVGAELEVTTLSAAREALASQETARLGVDTDLELSRLVEIEQAYAANAQVIQTAARMLDELQRIQ
ncbi:flagellar hook-associated protein FlgK [Paralimibaculum aggregatum]|uniref:Flagellar hook-associated protein 1 n=1 Tax=Paralimibaculum aggregatum TaxID=3036245 RepID=A0ABQ6LNJ5_9RHOB|nr:flagellar hook-associated protein FlgK [Limibaculum sp. NKW23]GMG83855.1 flagellar hook-associated protein FlgK [Limibaculum sp. NKW23]